MARRENGISLSEKVVLPPCSSVSGSLTPWIPGKELPSLTLRGTSFPLYFLLQGSEGRLKPRVFSAGGEGWSPPRWFFLYSPSLPFKMWLPVRLPFNSRQVQWALGLHEGRPRELGAACGRW